MLPEAVSENTTSTKFLNYDGIIPVLTEAIKQQQKLIEAQSKKIDVLMQEVEKLKKKKQ